jgi:hypothetical protein
MRVRGNEGCQSEKRDERLAVGMNEEGLRQTVKERRMQDKKARTMLMVIGKSCAGKEEVIV